MHVPLPHNRRLLFVCAAVLALTFTVQGWSGIKNQSSGSGNHLVEPSFAPDGIVFTRIPLDQTRNLKPLAEGMLRADFGEGGQIVLLRNHKITVLTSEFASASDPALSFDAKRILFAGKKSAADNWNIYEMNLDGSGLRQLTKDMGNCRTPMYQSALFYLNDAHPSYQITFVSDAGGELNEYRHVPSKNLYSLRLDLTGLRRLTFGISSSFDPVQMPDGRILFSKWQHTDKDSGLRGRIELAGIQLDGTDLTGFSGHQGRAIQHMACSSKRSVVFVESDDMPWDGAGTLASISTRRNLHSYKALTNPGEGFYHSPSALPDGTLLVSKRTARQGDTLKIYRLNLETRKESLVFGDPAYQSMQAIAVLARPEPDGHSSVVEDDQSWSKLYCLSVYQGGLSRDWIPPGTAKRLRVIEGIPLRASDLHGDGLGTIPKRLLGEVDIDEDGSFQVTVPPNTPIQLQVLDARGMALRTTPWIWTKNKENRGCIGCHEDPELTPENVFPMALSHPAPELLLPVERRRVVDFERDVQPILQAKCSTTACHGKPGDNQRGAPRRDLADYFGAPRGSQLLERGSARTSRLIWSIFGANTSRPWDKTFKDPAPPHMPPASSPQLTEDEKVTLIEWIDLGARLNPVPSHPSTAPTTGAAR